MDTGQNQQDLGQNIPVEVLPPSQPTVAVSGGGESAPKWFYFIFGVTVIAFFLVTTLLVFSLFKKQSSPSVSSGVLSSPTPAISPLGITVTQPPIPNPSTAPASLYIDKLKQVRSADTVAEIESDVNETDFAPIQAEISSLSADLDFTAK